MSKKVTAPAITTTVKRAIEETTTEIIDLGHGVEVCRITVVRQGPKGGNKTKNVSELVRHTRGKVEKNFGAFYVADPSLRQKLGRNGWFRDDKEYALLHHDDPFTHVTSGKPYEVLRVNSYDHTLYTVDDKRLPVAMQFSYIDGGVDNGNFDLKKLVDYLQTREDVTLREDRSGRLIHNIPYYNRESGRTTHLEFTWHPDVRTYQRYVKASESGSWARYTAAHTIMGNDKFRRPAPDDDENQ